MLDRERFGVKRGKNIYAKEKRTESRNNLVISQHTGSRTWEKIENNRIGDKKLLVARSN